MENNRAPRSFEQRAAQSAQSMWRPGSIGQISLFFPGQSDLAGLRRHWRMLEAQMASLSFIKFNSLEAAPDMVLREGKVEIGNSGSSQGHRS